MKTLLLGWIALGGLTDRQITVRVVNSGLIPDSVRQQGERKAAQILRSAGVTVRWVECPCPGDPGRSEYWLHILSQPPAWLKEAAGFAVLYPTPQGRDGYAGVFYGKVERTADEEQSDPATVLGAALAHEIGHLLLGTNSHSPSGVMRIRLGHSELVLASRGELRFTPEDVARIRTLWERKAGM